MTAAEMMFERAKMALERIAADSAAMNARINSADDVVHPKELAQFASDTLQFAAFLFTDSVALAEAPQPTTEAP